MSFRRAQSTVEYLVVVAIVVVIALFAAGVMGGFPVLSSGVSERESASYW